MANTEFTDEILMAYADGQLDRETAAHVQAAASADPALQARIAGFQATGDALARLATARQAAPVPETLQARVQQAMASARDSAAQEAKQSAAAKVLPFVRRGKPEDAPVPRRFAFVPMALAASLALVIGLGAGLALDGEPAADAWFATAALESAGIAGRLSTLPAGQEGDVPGGQMTVLASFKDGSGALCREFELKRPGQALVSVACHGEPGWEMRFAAAAGGAEGYAPASSV